MVRRFRGRLIPENYKELCEMWEHYYETNGTYPNSLICQKDFNLPSWSRVKSICGDSYEEFCIRFGINTLHIKEYSYEHYCELIKRLASKLGRTPYVKDLRKNKEIPDYRWLIKNCTDERVRNYNELMTYIGLKPLHSISKEMATNIILRKVNSLDRNLKIDDFKNLNKNEMGLTTINNIWGSFNNMLIDLGLPINQIGRSTMERSTKELENDIKKLCEYLYEKNGHKLVSLDDINNCEWCQSHGTYNRRFKREYNMTIGEYIEHLGYTPNVAGTGMNYTFTDGEITLSKYEYKVSKYLKGNKSRYLRNIKYNSFVNNYNGNKDCDYVIYVDDEVWYIEIAGMLRDATSIAHAKTLKLNNIHKEYLSDLIEKENMLKEAKVNYRILFPNDLKDMESTFSFLHKNN